jgi:DNA-binding XRE family transcriptional regulator
MSAVYAPGAGPLRDTSGTLPSPRVPRPKALYTAPHLERLRVARMLTQADRAAAAHVARTAIIRLEAGGSSRRSTIRKLAETLGVQPADLMHQPPEG